MRDVFILLTWVMAATVVFAAGYLAATRSRSRLAARVGLCGVALFGVASVMDLTAYTPEDVLRAVGVADGHRLLLAGRWAAKVHWTAACGLLIGAVLVDRPPPADDE